MRNLVVNHYHEEPSYDELWCLTSSYYVVLQDNGSIIRAIPLHSKDQKPLLERPIEGKGVCLDAFEVDVGHVRVVIGTNDGSLLHYHLRPDDGELQPEEEEDEDNGVVGECDAVAAVAWSPTGERIALATGSAVMLMTDGFDCITEVALGPGERAVRATWRPDGAAFAVGLLAASGEYSFAVFSGSDGRLEARSAAPPKPEGPYLGCLAFRPVGNLLACSQQGQVALFERNGLRRYEFPLLKGDVAVWLEWNCAGEVLAAVVKREEGPQKGAAMMMLQLWTRSNYHWYLKTELPCGPGMARWHPEKPLLLVTGRAGRVELGWELSALSRSDDLATAAVIDGASVKLTPLRMAVVPPPGSACAVPAPSAVVAAGFAWRGPSLLFTLHRPAAEDPALTLSLWGPYSPAGPREMETAPSLAASYALPPVSVCCQPLLANRGLFCYVAGPHDVRALTLEPSAAASSVSEARAPATPGRVSCLACLDDAVLAVALESGRVMTWRPGSSERWADFPGFQVGSPASFRRLEFACEGRWAVTLEDHTSGGRLRVQGLTVSDGVSSFALVGDAFLAFTTATALRFLRLPASASAAAPVPSARDLFLTPAPDATAAGLRLKGVATRSDDATFRMIERGAHLVAVAPGCSRVVLQMQRGNLEAVVPRILELGRVAALLDSGRYGDAFRALRVQRIDLNLMYEHCSWRFLRDLPLVVEQIGNPEHLNLLLSSLSSATSAAAAGAVAAHEAELKAQPHLAQLVGHLDPAAQKVTLVCRAVRAVLESGGFCAAHPDYLLSVLTSFARSDPPELEALLERARSAGPGRVEDAISYAAFLTDVGQLYRVALGMYDIPLALIVAQASSMDPREYLPFLRGLEAASEGRGSDTRRRRAIDEHLGRWERALAALIESVREEADGDWARAGLLPMVTARGLYKEAARLLDRPEERAVAREVHLAHASHHAEAGRFFEAGVAFSLAGRPRDALAHFVRGTCWEEALAVAALIPLTAEETLSLVKEELADALVMSGRHREAAEALAPLDPSAALGIALDGHQWRVAVRLGLARDPARLAAAALRAAADTAANLAAAVAEAETLNTRLQVVRAAQQQRARAAEAEAQGGGGGEDGVGPAAARDDDDDAASTVAFSESARSGSSSGTARTGTSRASSKNRRRLENRWFKEGSPYEEIYLVVTLGKLYPSREARAKTRDLEWCLTVQGLYREAEQLAASCAASSAKLRAVLERIWPKDEFLPVEMPEGGIPKGIPVPTRPNFED